MKGSATFSDCISQLAMKFKASSVQEQSPLFNAHFVTMAPFGNTNAEYADAYKKANGAFDIVNYQVHVHTYQEAMQTQIVAFIFWLMMSSNINVGTCLSTGSVIQLVG